MTYARDVDTALLRLAQDTADRLVPPAATFPEAVALIRWTGDTTILAAVWADAVDAAAEMIANDAGHDSEPAGDRADRHARYDNAVADLDRCVAQMAAYAPQQAA